MTRVSRHLDAEQITGYVEINPEDAASLNIKEGDSVVLSSRRGRMEAPARLSGAVKPGVFFLPIPFYQTIIAFSPPIRSAPALSASCP
jgi:anaerobic selenocysteine-containing dehydrogenase